MDTPTRIRRRVVRQGTEGSITKTMEKKDHGVVVKSAEKTEKFKAESIINPAYVTVNGSVTKNTGNFESVRVQVGISLPCLADEKTVTKTFNRLSEMVEQFVGIELDNALGEDGK